MISIRKAEEKDAEQLLAVKIRAFREEVALYGGGPLDFDSMDHQLENIRESHYYKILDDENTIIGGLGVRDKGDGVFWLCSIYIDDKFQNRGLGTLAMRFLDHEFPTAKKWVLETPCLSFRNHHFYEKLGFIKVGETDPEQDNNGFYLFLYEKMMPAA